MTHNIQFDMSICHEESLVLLSNVLLWKPYVIVSIGYLHSASRNPGFTEKTKLFLLTISEVIFYILPEPFQFSIFLHKQSSIE